MGVRGRGQGGCSHVGICNLCRCMSHCASSRARLGCPQLTLPRSFLPAGLYGALLGLWIFLNYLGPSLSGTPVCMSGCVPVIRHISWAWRGEGRTVYICCVRVGVCSLLSRGSLCCIKHSVWSEAQGGGCWAHRTCSSFSVLQGMLTRDLPESPEGLLPISL